MDQENKELLSVSDFAAKVGKTTSAVYQQLKGRLKNYVQVGDDGKSYISSEALGLYGVTPAPAKRSAAEKDGDETKGEVKRLKKDNEDLNEEVARLNGEISRLTEDGSRLEEANAQLKDANEQLKGANDELKEKITELTAENGRMALEIERLKMEKDHLNEMLAREQDLSRERWARLEAADRRIDSLMDKIPPMLPPASIESSSGGGLFGWLRKKKA